MLGPTVLPLCMRNNPLCCVYVSLWCFYCVIPLLLLKDAISSVNSFKNNLDRFWSNDNDAILPEPETEV